ncbi:nitrate/nitrite two-component system sensor histidine kinase NarQ [Enterovibrio calviensis]|uniref:nitrate/nitrite two-component system sensor histidine kinase NarQ n=1 Tax=Enterovibrio calviensis TaxID=91359 RepID=UPI003736BD37
MPNETTEITVKQSVTTIVARSLVAMLLLAVMITGFSIISLASSLNDAAAINTSGSLRMQSYRIAYDIVRDSPRLPEHIESFQRSLRSPELQLLDNPAVPQEIRARYNALISRWLLLRPELQGPDRAFYLEQVGLFVNDIDQFVFTLQQHSENKLQVLALVGSIGLGVILALVLFLIQYTQRRIVQPLNMLVTASQRIQNGIFDVALPPTRNNELGVLSKSFAIMASELKELYANLESRIESKTHKLTKANRSLNVLYDCSTQLSSSLLTRQSFENILDISMKADGISALTLTVISPNQSEWQIRAGKADDQHWHSLPLRLDDEALGTLTWQGKDDVVDSVLLENIASILARGVHYNHAQKQAMHLAVMEERATLARELHDSIAQSLSYLKIQTSLLKRHLQRSDAKECESIAEEIGEQLRIAYDQLRELLNAFRLSLSHSDFGLALNEMVVALKGQTSAEITMSSTLDTLCMDVQHQMHLLQIIREACINAIKHADASTISIRCHQHDNHAYVEIMDDGIGFCPTDEKPNHYGLNIMQERSNMLGGNIQILSAPSQGCRVVLTFDFA